MSFVVDGSEWQFDGWTADKVVSCIESLLGLIDTSRMRGETVWIGEDLQTRPIFAGQDLWTAFTSDQFMKLPAEIRHELAAWLNSAPLYLDEPNWPEGFEDSSLGIDGEPATVNDDAAWAHHCTRHGTAVGCLSFIRSGPKTTVSASGSATVHWVSTEGDRVIFWRAAIVFYGDNRDTLMRFSAHAYPNLHFHEDALAGVDDLEGGYLPLRGNVQKSLAVLNDHGSWAFTFPPPSLSPSEPMGPDPNLYPSNKIIEDRFHGFSIDIAPEKPEVHADKRCREAREILINGELLYCQWHIKLEPHRNRIHVYRPIEASNGKLIIAIICEHLPLP